MRKIYFPGLNGIRAIACMMIFYGHFNTSFHIHSEQSQHTILTNGVTCFFALSGFLITSLLLQEKKWTGRIHLGNFYLRRMLRIWPLYFLIILIGWFAHPLVAIPGERTSYFLYYLFFLGNFAFIARRCIWIINPLWSVAVEEQFYAFWPLVMDSSRVLRSCLVFLFTFLLVKIVARYSGTGFYYFLSLTRFDCMAIGGILAGLNFRQWPGLKLLYHPLVQCTCWALFALSFFRPLHLASFIDDECFALLVGILILNVGTNTRTLLTLENPALNYLGRISYGMYAYNMPVLYCWHYFIPADRIAQLPLLSYGTPLLVLSINIFVAHCSYHYFEKWFLKAKLKLGHMSSAMAT
jgi:peptidoglycan/LPS O-acetylase OafA/YrhL